VEGPGRTVWEVRAEEAQDIDGLKIVGGAIVVFGWLYVDWVGIGRGSHAMVVAARHGLSPYRIARPYNRWGVDARVDIWTLCGAFVGALLGLGIGWWLFDSLPVGILFGSAGALIAGWYYRVVGSLLAVERHAHDVVEAPPPVEHPELPDERPEAEGGARDRRLKLAPAALACGVIAAVFGLWGSDTHGPIALVVFVAIVVFVTWKVLRITDGQRAA
jgi:uncharacterized membrane protein YfcA